MNNLLENYRAELSRSVLDFLWSAWSQVGVMGGAAPARARLVDPEPLLLLTWECARQDARVFDEVLDWLVRNGKWINVTRLTTLLDEDQVCPPALAGAVAAFMTTQDKTLKWKTLARRYQPHGQAGAEPLFQRKGKGLALNATDRDETFAGYGWQRSGVALRGQGQPLPVWVEAPASFVFKCRAFFGVNMRADIFTYLVAKGASTASRLARELGYSQRRVQDTLVEMQMANVFQTYHDGNRKEYAIESAKGWQLLFAASPGPAEWFHWRAFARGIGKVWKNAFGLKEQGLTAYILDSEMAGALEEAREDLAAAGISLPNKPTGRSLVQAIHGLIGKYEGGTRCCAPCKERGSSVEITRRTGLL